MDNAKIEKLLRIGILLIFAGVVFSMGWFSHNISLKLSINDTKEVRQDGFKFINPLLECETSSNELFAPELKEIKEKIKELELSEKNNRNINHLSLYFRDLTNGPWIGINEKDPFTPSSLLKVPIMMAIYKQAESDRGFLKKEILLKNTGLSNAEQNVVPEKKAEYGQTYTVEELLEYMMIYSDNNAKSILYENTDQKVLTSVFNDLGVTFPTIEKPENYMAVREYSSFFRILYNSSYLEREYSEKALEIMSKSTFNKGLRKYIPTSVVIAHKFGERGLPDSDIKQLHDCGIVYYPEHPYLVCVMTRGNDFDKLAETIAKASKSVFEIIDKTYKK